MTDLADAIHQAVTTEYWNHPYPRNMARAAAEVAGVGSADIGELTNIVNRHLLGPDFVAMANELAKALESSFTINDHLFTLARHAGGCIWVCGAVESLVFAEACQAQQDAMRYARQLAEREMAA